MIRESGIYEEEIKIVLNPKRIGPDYGDKTEVKTVDFQEIFLGQLHGIVFLLGVLLFISCVVFILEIFSAKFNRKFDSFQLKSQSH